MRNSRWQRVVGATIALACTACGSSAPQSSDAVEQLTPSPQAVVRPTVAPITPDDLALPDSTSTPYPTAIVQQVVDDPLVQQIVAGLEQRGFVITPSGVSRVELLRAAPGQAYRLDDGYLHLHVYPNAESAAADAATLPDQLRVGILDWVAPPHFFGCKQVIALYLGAEPTVIDALSSECAPPFFTTDLAVAPPEPTPASLTTINRALEALLHMRAPTEAITAPQIRAQLPLGSGVALLYTYAAIHNNESVKITRWSYLDWSDPVWYPDGDQIELQRDAALPVQWMSGTYVINGGPDTPEKPDTIAFAGGLVHDPAVQRVRVIFGDGSQTVVPVNHGAYLAAQLDVERVVRIEALNLGGATLHQTTPP